MTLSRGFGSEDQQAGVGSYFVESIYSDIESLRLFAGIHRTAYRNLHRMLSKRFPFAIFYDFEGDAVRVHAIVDCRRNPAWIRGHLK